MHCHYSILAALSHYLVRRLFVHRHACHKVVGVVVLPDLLPQGVSVHVAKNVAHFVTSEGQCFWIRPVIRANPVVILTACDLIARRVVVGEPSLLRPITLQFLELEPVAILGKVSTQGATCPPLTLFLATNSTEGDGRSMPEPAKLLASALQTWHLRCAHVQKQSSKLHLRTL